MDYPKKDAHGNPETPWAIRCGSHKLVYLDRRQYDEQMNRANSLWYCPISPGMCESVYWDNDNFERFVEDDFDEAMS